MERRSLLALFTPLLSRAAGREPAPPPADPRRPDEVYQAALALRSRIDAALAASRRD